MKAPRTDRHAALQLAGEHELRRLSTAYPGKVFPRTARDAFSEHWRGTVEHHRQPLHVRVAGWIRGAAVLGMFALIGVLLAYRG